MAESYYFDTSIWLDIYDKRGYNGEVASKLMEIIVLGDHKVMYSNAVVVEFKKLGFSSHEINTILGIAKPEHITRVHASKDQIREAKRLAKQRKIPRGDALHTILSRDHGAQLVSRDHHFDKLKDITKAKKPEELI